MAPKLPKGFGPVKKGETKAGASTAKARLVPPKDSGRDANERDSGKGPVQRDDGKRVVDTPLKRPVIDTPSGALPLKKQRTEGASSFVESLVGPVAAAYVEEDQVREWQSMPVSTQELAMVKASVQLLIHTMGRAQKSAEGKQAFIKLQAENKRLQGLLAETEGKWKKELDASKAEGRALKEEVKDASEREVTLRQSLDQLSSERESMQTRLASLEKEKLGWAKEKQTLEEVQFQNGFDCYLIGFLARVPEFDWTAFGSECVSDIVKFKVDRASDIKAKRVELGLEEDEDASNDDQGHVSSPADKSVPEPGVTIPLQVAPPEGASPRTAADAT